MVARPEADRTTEAPTPYAPLPGASWRDRVLIIDNEDSFSHNLAQSFALAGERVAVVRHDRADVAEIRAARPKALVLSPGPRTPDDFPLTLALAAGEAHLPLLGVCLGQQALAVAFGGRLVRALRPMHGKQSPIHHDGGGLFEGLSSPLTVGRYHSLIVDAATLPSQLEITAWSAEHEPMALRHRHLPLYGVQFHPESFLTAQGVDLLRNFLRLATRTPELTHA
jgi:anthranilate synthase/aminodeoxychorismate synthase-like glutamine amidotransferase